MEVWISGWPCFEIYKHCAVRVWYSSLLVSDNSSLPSHGSWTLYKFFGDAVAHPVPVLYTLGASSIMLST